MNILIVAEVVGGAFALDSTAKAVKAFEGQGTVDLLVAGKDVADVSKQAATISGVRKVLVADDEQYAHQLPEPMASLLVSLSGYDTVAAPATAQARSALPRFAALMDVMVIPDVIEIIAPDSFRRPIYAGNAFQVVQTSDALRVLTIRTANFDAAELGGTAEIASVASATDPALTAWVEDSVVKNDRPELTSAKLVVSGGRGVGSKEGFKIIDALASKLGAAVGASRAAVDSGYAPNDFQVGQTGKIVAPDLYVACGISGAIQHLAGMKDSKTIVAINSDPDAPIFQVADFGLVADIFDAIPEMTERV
jgi:electron transfer flavoprotein alpha subunit|tara:strand:+ start:16260 stop:17183 length:924 start_codon:yes stop_codon:yes gene_type:complete